MQDFVFEECESCQPISDVPISDVPISDVSISDVPIPDVPIPDVPISDVPIWEASWGDLRDLGYPRAPRVI